MNLIVVAPFFPPDPTGSSVFAFQQSVHLAKLGHSVLVVTNDPDSVAPEWESDPDIDLLSHGVSVLRLKNFRINLGSLSWNYRLPVSLPGLLRPKFWARFRPFRADAVIIHSTLFDLSVFALAWSAIRRKPNVLVCHTALWHNHSLIRLLLGIFGRFVLRPLLQSASTQVVCVDKFTYENASRLFGKRVECSIIPISVDGKSVTNGNGNYVREKYGITGSPVLLSLGHVIPLRNRVNLVRSLPLLVQHFPEIKVVVVGMVMDQTAIDLAEELGVRKHLLFTGAVRHAEIADFLDLADVEAHDLNGLGLGITSVEAMSAGTPIVAWVDPDNYPTMNRQHLETSGFINDGEPSTISEAIVRIIEDDQFRKTTLEVQYSVVRDVFSAEAVNEQYMTLLQENRRRFSK